MAQLSQEPDSPTLIEFKHRLQTEWTRPVACQDECIPPESCICERHIIHVDALKAWWTWQASESTHQTKLDRLLDEMPPTKHRMTPLFKLLKLFTGDHSCLLVFSLLLNQGRGHFIDRFSDSGMIDKFLNMDLVSSGILESLHENLAHVTHPSDRNLIIENFQKERWAYCPLKLTLHMSRNLEGTKVIPPFCHKIKLGEKGGTASVYWVAIQKDLISDTGLQDALHDSVYQDEAFGECYQMVLKSYCGNMKKEYEAEREAFSFLKSNEQVPIVRYLGHYSHSFGEGSDMGTTYNLLLECGERDLYQTWADETNVPPVRAKEIVQYWKSLFKVADAIHHVHHIEVERWKRAPLRFHGWHADIKPDNILVVHGRLKLADFGFSTFVPYAHRRDGSVLTGLIRGFTDTYGAPEVSRMKQPDGTLAGVTQSIDVWSFGCVLSVAATWVVLGFQGVRQYERLRQLSPTNIKNNVIYDRFHEGIRPLPEIGKWHDYLREHLRPSDTTTPLVLELIEHDMLQADPSCRLDLEGLCGKLEDIVGLATQKINNMMKSSRDTDEVVLKALLKHKEELQNNAVVGRSVSFLTPRMATAHQLLLEEEAIQRYLHDVGTIDLVRSSTARDIWSIVRGIAITAKSTTPLYTRLSPMSRNTRTNSSRQRVPSRKFGKGNSQRQATCRRESVGSTLRIRDATSISRSSCHHPSIPVGNTTTKYFSNRHSMQSQTKRITKSTPLWQTTHRRELLDNESKSVSISKEYDEQSVGELHNGVIPPMFTGTTPVNPRGNTENLHQSDKIATKLLNRDPHFQFNIERIMELDQAETSLSPTQLTTTLLQPATPALPLPPSVYVLPFDICRRRGELDREFFSKALGKMVGKFGVNVETTYKDSLLAQTLYERRKLILVVDNGSSMSCHWPIVMFVAETLAKTAAGLTKNGIDIKFTVDGRTHDKEDLKGDSARRSLMESLYAAWPKNRKTADSLTDMGPVFANILREWKQNKQRATTLLILTDGVWSKTEPSALNATILDIAKREQQYAGNRHFSIQFIRFGDRENEKAKLQSLDDVLCAQHGLRDIIDHCSWRMTVHKMFQGSIEAWYDMKDEYDPDIPYNYPDLIALFRSFNESSNTLLPLSKAHQTSSWSLDHNSDPNSPWKDSAVPEERMDSLSLHVRASSSHSQLSSTKLELESQLTPHNASVDESAQSNPRLAYSIPQVTYFIPGTSDPDIVGGLVSKGPSSSEPPPVNSWPGTNRPTQSSIGAITPPYGHSDPSAIGHVEVITTTKKTTRLLGEKTIIEHTMEVHEGHQSIWRMFITSLKRNARPAVPKGYRRIEWVCDCGDDMYGDYDNRDPVALDKLLHDLQQRPHNNKRIWEDITASESILTGEVHQLQPVSDSSGGNGGGSPAANSSGSVSSIGLGQTSPAQGITSNLEGSNSANGSAQMMQPALGNFPGTTSQTSVRQKKYFELCVNTGEIDINLSEIDITDVTSDGELFKKIYAEYANIRGHRMRRFFLKPVNIHFVRFSVQKRYRVGIYEQPLAIPFETEVQEKRYHYEECPLDVQPPMDHRTFFHYMQKHQHGDSKNPSGMTIHGDAIFLQRLPKKVGNSVLVGQRCALPFGWGVHIIEGPNKVALSWTTFVGLLLSFVVSALYCYFWRTQEQGFAIGQWMVAVIAAGMAALYFQWAET